MGLLAALGRFGDGGHDVIKTASASTACAIGALVGALVLSGCAFVEPTADELLGSLDRLEFGPEWQLQSEEVAERPCEQITDACPRAARVYRVEAAEFPTSVSVLDGAGFKTRALFQSCIEHPDKGCRAQGWDEDVSITMTITSEVGTDVEVLARAVKRVGPEPRD